VYVLPTMGYFDLRLSALQLFSTNSIIVLGIDTLRSENTIKKIKFTVAYVAAYRAKFIDHNDVKLSRMLYIQTI
jgi:hypothetical protein